MNRTIATALVIAAAAFAGSAMADDITPDVAPIQSATTRAQVQAELAAFKKAGVNPWSTQYNPVANFKSVRTTTEVRAELQAARAETAALTSEDSGSAYLSRIGAAPSSNISATLAGQARNTAN